MKHQRQNVNKTILLMECNSLDAGDIGEGIDRETGHKSSRG